MKRDNTAEKKLRIELLRTYYEYCQLLIVISNYGATNQLTHFILSEIHQRMFRDDKLIPFDRTSTTENTKVFNEIPKIPLEPVEWGEQCKRMP